MRLFSVGVAFLFLASLADAQAPAAEPTSRPTANLAQLMRGIMFPNSNIIFNVQSQDPAAPKPIYEPGKAPFSWVDWGAGIYTGWEVVENAAIALEEAPDLIMKPGRLCTNGKPVPVERADFAKFAQNLRLAARAALAAAREKSQEKVSEATNQLAEACFSCHNVYRTAPPGEPRRCEP
jgi:hypothetical protein